MRKKLGKFEQVLKRMFDTFHEHSKRRGIEELKFIPVYIDRRRATNDEMQFWMEYWQDYDASGDYPLGSIRPGLGSAQSIPHLFPCIAHRFVLLETKGN